MPVDAKRSKIMRAVGRRDTKPEIAVRRLLHEMGLRFRLQRKDLPGTPDLVLPKYRTVIFTHGCFWHRHGNCSKATTPKTRAEFWQRKFDDNIARDAASEVKLIEQGWRVLIIWECETTKPEALKRRLRHEFSIPCSPLDLASVIEFGDP